MPLTHAKYNQSRDCEGISQVYNVLPIFELLYNTQLLSIIIDFYVHIYIFYVFHALTEVLGKRCNLRIPRNSV